MSLIHQGLGLGTVLSVPTPSQSYQDYAFLYLSFRILEDTAWLAPVLPFSFHPPPFYPFPILILSAFLSFESIFADSPRIWLMDSSPRQIHGLAK